MTVDRDKAAATANHAGQTWHFCGTHCHQKFVADPSRYLKEAVPAAAAAKAGAEYTCPMHPEVRQVGPVICPKCGMGLEPLDQPATSKVEYVCPMHPEVVSDHPGPCSKCRMALESCTVELQDGPSHEQTHMTRRFWAGLVLGLPVFTKTLIGSMALGWGLFNLVEGIIDHHLLHIHHVTGTENHLIWYLAFLASGLLLIGIGATMISAGRKDAIARTP